MLTHRLTSKRWLWFALELSDQDFKITMISGFRKIDGVFHLRNKICIKNNKMEILEQKGQ